MNQKRLPPAKRSESLFTKRARTMILCVVSVALVAFVLLPIAFDRLSGANAAFVSAEVAQEQLVPPTPAPIDLESRALATESEEPIQSAEPTQGVQVSQYTPLREADNYPSVQKLQSRLMELGYLDSDEPSTIYNAATSAAVALFQRTLNFEMDGVANSELQEALFDSEAASYEMKIGDTGADVETMQSRLNELGYYEGKINGYFGVATEEALKAFQTKNKLASDGVFNIEDRDLIYSTKARPKIDPTPTPTPKPTPKPTQKPTKTSSGSTTSGGSTSGGSTSGSDSSDTSSDASYTASYSADGLISVATAMMGKPYSWSEESPSKGFDCSGLVYFCLRTCGVSTSRYSASGFSGNGSWTEITSIGDLRKGDLLFFRNDTSSRVSHTGIYIGGDHFIHASSSSGKVVRSNITTSYWTRNFVNARRVFG